jgi:radical SAM protein with 4Fe4S-binding SPASM domain
MEKPQYEQEGIKHATINGHRFHLRLADPSLLNPLWIDGQPPLMLDQVAGEFVSHIIDAMWQFQTGPEDESGKVVNYVIEQMCQKYSRRTLLPWKRITRERIKADLDRIYGTLMRIANGDCPVEAGLTMKEISPSEWIAPGRMDLALTYKCNLNCNKCYRSCSNVSGKSEELSTEKWKDILKVLWKTGIPNVVFTGGEPTLRSDLTELINEAEKFVTGLVTNGTKLKELIPELKQASLDYIQVTLESDTADVHNRIVGAEFDAYSATVGAIVEGLKYGMQIITNTTLTKDNYSGFGNLLRFGKQLGLKNMSCNTLICSGRGKEEKKLKGLSPETLKMTLQQATGIAQEIGINLQWYSPTCYKHLNPIELGFGVKGCSAAAYNMLIEPDGKVLPCQSWPDSVGNILADPWEKIWQHPTCIKLRNHGYAKDNKECTACIHNKTCAGACPLEYAFE